MSGLVEEGTLVSQGETDPFIKVGSKQSFFFIFQFYLLKFHLD